MMKIIKDKPEMRKIPYGSLPPGACFENDMGVLLMKTDHKGSCNMTASTSLSDGSRFSIPESELVIPVVVEAKVVSRG